MVSPAPDSFNAASLATLAPAHQLNRMGKSAQAGLTDRRPHPVGTNIWRSLISRRRGYLFALKVLQRIITEARKHGSTSKKFYPSIKPKALFSLLQVERETRYRTMEKRRGNPSYALLEQSGIQFLSGRKLVPGNETNPSVLKQDKHILIAEQTDRYCVPVLNPETSLGRAVTESTHNEF